MATIIRCVGRRQLELSKQADGTFLVRILIPPKVLANLVLEASEWRLLKAAVVDLGKRAPKKAAQA